MSQACDPSACARRGTVHRRQRRQAAGVAAQAVRYQKLPAAFSGPARGLRRRRAIRQADRRYGGETRWTSASNLPGQRSRACGRGPGRDPRGGAARPRQVRGDLPAAGAEEAHEGRSGSRLPRAVPCSRSRGVAAPQGNAHRRALEDGTQLHRPAGALSCPSTALWLQEVGNQSRNGDRTDCVGLGDVQHGPTRQRLQGKSR